MSARVERSTRKDQLRSRLSAAGCRVTRQRLAIIDALLVPGRHPTAEEIHADVLRLNPTTSLATVYKTVETLRVLGELKEMELGTGRAHYDAIDPADHPHVTCVRCGRIEDVEIGGFDSLGESARQASAYAIQSMRLDFFGVCPGCRD